MLMVNDARTQLNAYLKNNFILVHDTAVILLLFRMYTRTNFKEVVSHDTFSIILNSEKLV